MIGIVTISLSAGEQTVKDLIAINRYGLFCIFDLDDFKTINDQFGHHEGDIVLQTFAKNLCDGSRKSDIIFRLGGDEFASYAPGVTNEAAARVYINHVYETINKTPIDDVPEIKLRVSTGGAFFTAEDKTDFESLYKKSDAALYIA